MKPATRSALLADLRADIQELQSRHEGHPIRACLATGDKERLLDNEWVNNLVEGNKLFTAHWSGVAIGGLVPLYSQGDRQRIVVFQEADPNNRAIVELLRLLNKHSVAFDGELPTAEGPDYEAWPCQLHWWVERVVHWVKRDEVAVFDIVLANRLARRGEGEGEPGFRPVGVDDLLAASIQYLHMVENDEPGSEDWEVLVSVLTPPASRQLGNLGVVTQQRADVAGHTGSGPEPGEAARSSETTGQTETARRKGRPPVADSADTRIEKLIESGRFDGKPDELAREAKVFDAEGAPDTHRVKRVRDRIRQRIRRKATSRRKA